ncbi:tRNA (adenosine(37)-N6)-threonylcarbamoyltransferase complex ATPase subunit type 1 TsaE [Camelliibacillus cellulosilyticus]|uniref:tRNA threonylcarbamoyladenosine biosynthesis protein TsaE n=1 Tax=Camelliibacillus cellulosilyticus TaxID=2174486 RepID=A0ABV9GUI9_9BACL
MFVYHSSSAEDTMAFGEKMSAHLEPGDVLTLQGDLGAGKTTFTKGLAKGLGIERTVNSPTFTIIKEYHGNLPLYHMDVYRLSEEEDLGFDDYFYSDGVTVIEWAERLGSQLPEERLELTFKQQRERERTIMCMPKGSRYERLCKELAR